MSGPPPPRRLPQLLRGIGALIVLVVVVAGVPLLLTALHLTPHGLPSLHQLNLALRRRDNGQLVAVVLAAGVWICWALFTLSVLGEIVAATRNRPASPLPGLGVFQRPAATLVGAIAIALTVAPLIGNAAGAHAAPAPPLLPRGTAFQQQPVLHAPPVAPASAATQADHATESRKVPRAHPTYRVRRHDTLWAIAQRYLHDPLRYPELVELNPDRIGTDNAIRPGTVLVLPADATGLPPPSDPAAGGGKYDERQVTVRPGDTLWSIEQHVTGEGANWHQAWLDNRDRAEPDGRTFDEPNLILPGWTLTIPTTPRHPDPTHHHPSGPPARPPQRDPSTPPRGGGTRTPPPQSTPSTPTPSSTPTRVPPTSQAPSPAPSQHGDASPDVTPPGRAQTGTGAREASDDAAELATIAAAGTSLLAGLLATALTRRRRRQLRHRRPGRSIAQPPPRLQRTERTLAAAAARGMTDVTFLNRALRGLPDTLAHAPDARLPDVLGAYLRADGLELILAAPAAQPPAPWSLGDTDRSWRLRREKRDLPENCEPCRNHIAPYPGLATVATAGDAALLLDLERLGTLAITGPATQRRALLRYLAAELAHNTWSEQVHVTLIGLGNDMADLDPARLSCTDDLDAGGCVVHAHLADMADTADDGDVLVERLHNAATDIGSQIILIDIPDTDDDAAADESRGDPADLLAAIAAVTENGHRADIAVVVASDQPQPAARCQLNIDAAATMTVPFLPPPDAPLTGCQIPADEAADLAALLALAADVTDRPMPAAHGAAPWDRYADAAGGLRPEPATARAAPDDTADTSASANAASGVPDAEPADVPDPAAASTSSVLPPPDTVCLPQIAATPSDLDTLAPAISDATHHRIATADPDLDQALTAWHSTDNGTPKLRLLGPPSITGVGEPPAGRGALLTEIVAYLATRPHGAATVEQLATDLWPHIPDAADKTTPRQVVSMTRQWLGVNPKTGRHRLPKALPDESGAKLYRVRGVLVDADLFRRLRIRGTATGPEGIADLQAALDLVTGTPFAQHRAGGYGWLANTPLDHEYTAMIIDTAHLVATHHLAAAQPEAAAAAAQVAQHAAPNDDVALLDLIAAAEALDNHAEAQSYVRRLLAGHDAEVEEDLPTRTYEILLRNGWLPD